MSDSLWTWKSLEPLQSFQKSNKRLSDLQMSSKKRYSGDNNELNDSNKSGISSNTGSKSEYLKCKNVGIMEEELYVKDNVVIWTKGLVSTGNTMQFDTSRVTICSYTSRYPIRFAQWCTFYCERPVFDNLNIDNNKLDEPSGTPMSSICIIDDQNMQVFTVDNEDFITTLPFRCSGLWTTRFGVILEKEKSKCLLLLYFYLGVIT